MGTAQVKLRQLQVNNAHYVFMDEPALCAPWVQSQASLQVVQCHGKSVYMTPREKPYTCLIQFESNDNGLEPLFWMERTACIEHMRAFILKNQTSDAETMLDEKQLLGFSLPYLFAVYHG